MSCKELIEKLKKCNLETSTEQDLLKIKALLQYATLLFSKGNE